MHSHFWNVLVVVMQALAIILLLLCIMEFRKRTALGKMIGTAWLAFALLLACVATGFHITNITWHLRNSQKPWLLLSILNGAGVVFFLVGSIVSIKVIRVGEKDKEDSLAPKETEVSGEVWPPPPRNP